MSRRNNVRGPSSALTSFLKDSGITAASVARRAATRRQPSRLAQTTTASTSEGQDGGNQQDSEQPQEKEPEQSVAGPSRRRARRTLDYDSDELDEPDEEHKKAPNRDEEEPSPKRRKTNAKSKAAPAKAEKENAKAKGKGKGKSKKGKGSDDDYEDDDDDAYNGLSLWSTNASKPPVGSFENCAKCEKQFTVTKYTMAANPPPGYLCLPCSKSSGSDPFKKPVAPRKRKATEDRRKIVYFEEKQFPTLVSMCIQLVSDYIDDVEALGLDGTNMDAIAKTLAKTRKLNEQNAPLFYDAQQTNLTLYDVTNLTPPALCALGSLNPSLTHLRLDFCGRMDDSVLNSWPRSMPQLTRIELLGPFLVRRDAWISFFASHPQLTGFLITQSPRFDLACVKALVRSCPELRELRLKEVGRMADDWLDELCTLAGSLEYLELSYPGRSLSEDALVGLLEFVGPGLTHLDLSGQSMITDGFMEDGIVPNVGKLQKLKLADVPQLTDEGVANLFDTWVDEKEPDYNPPLTEISMPRNHLLTSEALLALMNHSGPELMHLDINGWKDTGREGVLEDLGEYCRKLKTVDIGFCREVNDFVVQGILDNCADVREIKIWGCNKVTETCPKKRGVNILGFEAHVV
ncbi:RNI-like protein [Punctularia strigosozonata HHB-11173 SS5]|uniref:RNI-like protein n=1 Tax=Punctularia strigosozonata (strain HHB-11173) TaxID=741275 RepID=UPI0004417BED|nr:RNI-like protein [Punctularia strigosozonata HHB-11173 SS5]EIN07847.1 RNI-like protein [Punctularia strigosozonata HHB-11173 SS5]